MKSATSHLINTRGGAEEGQDMKKQIQNTEAADLWAAHIVVRRSQSAAAMLPPHAAWPAQISGRAIRSHL